MAMTYREGCFQGWKFSLNVPNVDLECQSLKSAMQFLLCFCSASPPPPRPPHPTEKHAAACSNSQLCMMLCSSAVSAPRQPKA